MIPKLLRCSLVFALLQLSLRAYSDVLRVAYFALVHSKVSYGLLAWGHSSIFPRIFRLQSRAVRVVANISYRGDCRQAFINFKIPTLPSQYALECLLHLHKNQDKYEMYTHQYNAKCKHNLKLPFGRLTKSRDRISYYGPKLF
nr:unnamed protein product [Callosobruchus chinensis]